MVKKIIRFIICLVILIIVGTTVYKLVDRHNNRLYEVMYSKIKERAKKCNLEEKCTDNIKLYELYEKGYIEVQYDPISKEELNKDLEIIITEEEIKINN